MKCPHCKVNDLEKDNHHGQDHLVCTACGYVVEHQSFDSSYNASGSLNSGIAVEKCNTLPKGYYNRTGYKKRTAQGTTDGLEKVDYTCSVLNLDMSIKKQSRQLFENLLSQTNFKKIEYKEAMGVCAVYTLCRQQHYPLIMRWLCNKAQVNFHVFQKVITILLKEELVKFPSQRIEGMLELQCNRAGFEMEIEKTAMSLLNLMQDNILAPMTNRNMNTVIIPLIFIAWQSHDPSARLKAKIRQFCLQFHFEISSSYSKQLKIFQTILNGLAQNIPWLSEEDLENGKFIYYIENILTYQNILSAEISSETVDKVSQLSLPAKKPRNKTAEDDNDEEPISKLRKVSDDPILLEEDLPDSELHLYIRDYENFLSDERSKKV